MYTDHWKLERKPFENTPDPAFFYLSPSNAEALDRFAYLVNERKGAGLLTGEYGCGKTTMIQMLNERVDLDQHRVAHLRYPRFDREELLVEMLRQLGEEPNGDGVSRMMRLGELFYRTSEEGAHTLVIVDEAQIINDRDVLEELRLLLNHQLEDAHLVTFLLVGQPELRSQVMEVPPLDQRIEVRYHLEPLDRSHTGSYVAFRMEVAGRSDPVFSEEAIDWIYEKSGGTPREINSMCDMSLFLGARRGVHEIDNDLVRMVA